MQLDGLPEGAATEGMPPDAVYTVTEVYDTHVVLDGNHPLAGVALVLGLRVRDVRAATATEIEQGTVAQQTVSVLDGGAGSSLLH
jgi:FKBP-type peptidyl-prolyl cis-trans isomerase SlyD